MVSCIRLFLSARRGGVGREGSAVAGDNLRERGDAQDAVTVGVERGEIGGAGILNGALGVPPKVGEGDDATGGADEGGDVLRAVAGGLDEQDGGGDGKALGGAAYPEV